VTIVHAVHHTSDISWWEQVLPVLGFSTTDHPGTWAGGGLLTIRQAGAADQDGATELEVLVPDPASALTAADKVAHTAQETVRATDGITITVSSAVDDLRTPTLDSGQTQVAVMPIWYSPDPDQPLAVLSALGLAPRLASDAGSWRDFTADGGGQVAWHGSPSVALQLSLEHSGDLDALVPALAEVGANATVVDEAYNRTLLIDAPHGAKLWVNGTQQDLYGYTRMDQG